MQNITGKDFGVLVSNVKLDYAVGDFDSISAQELKTLESYTNVIKLNPIKDETDTLYALRMFREYDNLYLLGGISGSRIDHFVANLKLLYEFENLVIIDENTDITNAKLTLYQFNEETMQNEIVTDSYVDSVTGEVKVVEKEQV